MLFRSQREQHNLKIVRLQNQHDDTKQHWLKKQDEVMQHVIKMAVDELKEQHEKEIKHYFARGVPARMGIEK